MIVYTGATFDVTHAGHVNFLRQVKELFPNCKLVVSLNTDDFIERYKGKKPLFNYEERSKLIIGTGYVDLVIPNSGGEDSKPAVLLSGASVVAIGSDWLKKNYLAQMSFTEEWLRENGISLIYIPYTDNISTTEIKKRIQNA